MEMIESWKFHNFFRKLKLKQDGNNEDIFLGHSILYIIFIKKFGQDIKTTFTQFNWVDMKN